MKLQPKDKIRLRHMLDAAQKTVGFTNGKTRKDLDTDEKLAFAVVRLIEVIGEAAKGITVDVRQSYPGIPWKDIAGARDRLIHGYFDVDLNIVWQIVSKDLPLLIDELEKMISPHS